MTVSPTTAKWIHIAIVVLTAVSLLGPTVSELAGVVPATWLAVATRIIGFAGAVVLWASSSPLVQPFLQMHSPAARIVAATESAVAVAANDNATAPAVLADTAKALIVSSNKVAAVAAIPPIAA